MGFGSLEVFVSDVGHEFRKGDHFEISVKAEDFVLNAFKLDFPGWSEGRPCGAAVGWDGSDIRFIDSEFVADR